MCLKGVVSAAQVKHLQETMSTDAATIQRLQTQLSDAQAIIDSFEEQAANQVSRDYMHGHKAWFEAPPVRAIYVGTHSCCY